jgi:hypothetical protein
MTDVHLAPHRSGAVGSPHPHTPPVHVWPEGHATPQAPQFAASLFKSTQLVPHAVAVPGQVQAPEWHDWVGPQATLHDPQWAGSLIETDTPEQVWQASIWPSQSSSKLPSQARGVALARQAQTECERSSGWMQRQFWAAGQSASVAQARLQTPPFGSTRTQRSD